ncbi:MAG: winged helix-turn-helix domain-containing protein [Bacteroidales bacterium]
MSNRLRFESFEVDLESGEVRKAGCPIRIREQSFQVLACLLERRGELVSRHDLRTRLWSDELFVDFDNGLNTAVARLRAVLGDCVERPHFIETVPKRGYRFLAHVRPSGTPVERTTRRLVVLPFVHGGDNPADEHLADVVTDELITALASVAPPHLAIIARTTAMRYKGSRKDVSRIARELNAEFVVEGVARCREQRVTMNVHLIQAGDQTHLYADRYVVALDATYEAQDRIARVIVEHIPSPHDAAFLRGAVTRPPSRAA